MLHAYCRKISTEVDKILMMTQDKDYLFPKIAVDIYFFQILVHFYGAKSNLD